MTKFKLKAYIYAGIAVISLIMVLVVLANYCLYQCLKFLERREAGRNTERVAGAFTKELLFFEKESKYLVRLHEANVSKNKNPEHAADNIQDSMLSDFNMNLVILASRSGRIIDGRYLDFHGGNRHGIPEYFRRIIDPDSPLLKSGGNVCGLVNFPGRSMLVASISTIGSGGTNKSSCVIITGRTIEKEFLDRLKQSVGVPVLIRIMNNNALEDKRYLNRHPDKRSAENVVLPVDENDSAVSLVKDIFGKPGLILSANSNNNVLGNGLKFPRYLTLWFSVAVLGAALIINTLFIKLVLSRRKDLESEHRYQSLVRQASDGIVLVDFKSRKILEANTAFFMLLGYNEKESIGAAISGIIADEEGKTIDHAILQVLKEKRELQLRRKDGSLLDAEVSACFVTHQKSEAICFLIHDVTESNSLKKRLLHEATHDTLTGLPNRRMLYEHLSRALAYDKRQKQVLALFLLDLDNFKIVNDTLGHQAGDQLLKEVAARLGFCVRSYDMVVRLGGDEFIVVFSGIQNSKDIVSIADKIRSIFAHPFLILGHEMFISTSIGIAVAPTDGEGPEVLLSNADTAMYHVKGSGKNSYMFFSEEMNARMSGRLKMETMLRRALERDEFELHYQPKVNLTTGSIVGMEALLRWRPAEEGRVVPPSEFIPLLEETGMIVDVSGWVLRQVCGLVKSWLKAGLPPLVVSTNISARHFYQNNLPEEIDRVISESGLEPRYLKIELTESIVMRDIDEAAKQLKRLKQMGVSLSIDDFGTGYASLNYLKQFPVDEIKIDRSFIRGLPDDPNDATIVSTIISIAHKLNLTVIAEGVETSSQLQFLRDKNCHEVQGFYFSRPLTAVAFEDMIRTGPIFESYIHGSAVMSQ
ncbi:MAG TPA: EAL domain-containing protein [Geobacteraceae bacterium]|nr:EAL domain-containing protein [Geobacteraceae bacterium]